MGMLDYVVNCKTERHAARRQKILEGEIPHWVKSSKRHRYIAAIILSAPPWVDRAALLNLQYRCRCISEMTGVPHELNHIVPLNHPRVCGLTVPWNLEIITAKRNNQLGNHFPDDRQLELF